ncbi:uncharacterized protein B0I36DRAFT_95184 [Microdochium trichocladiopsis]|uniref:Uncharacterized protein n=1 Tax=Microdochium trichocladiopsis TaxID=1682393 RepID=A0A9P9BT74_9PEZI|nr:uncharacterized protein B0I36DRAFT_95184 [Microdochium trichocladiopsis]KAH7035655.1 hypothetical protein B0I36DRAFT_95184 [Microdochium trichocladiopsis]
MLPYESWRQAETFHALMSAQCRAMRRQATGGKYPFLRTRLQVWASNCAGRVQQQSRGGSAVVVDAQRLHEHPPCEASTIMGDGLPPACLEPCVLGTGSFMSPWELAEPSTLLGLPLRRKLLTSGLHALLAQSVGNDWVFRTPVAEARRMMWNLPCRPCMLGHVSEIFWLGWETRLIVQSCFCGPLFIQQPLSTWSLDGLAVSWTAWVSFCCF